MLPMPMTAAEAAEGAAAEGAAAVEAEGAVARGGMVMAAVVVLGLAAVQVVQGDMVVAARAPAPALPDIAVAAKTPALLGMPAPALA